MGVVYGKYLEPVNWHDYVPKERPETQVMKTIPKGRSGTAGKGSLKERRVDPRGGYYEINHSG